MAAQFLGWKDLAGGENGNPFQYYNLENSMERGAWHAMVYGVKKELDTT